MSRLEELKAEKSKELGYYNWQHLLWANGIFDVEKYNNEVTMEYAKECSQASLEKASENVKMKMKKNIEDLSMMDDWSEIDRESITNPDNIILV